MPSGRCSKDCAADGLTRGLQMPCEEASDQARVGFLCLADEDSARMATQPGPLPCASGSPRMSLADELNKLNELRFSGALSDAEFEKAKAALLSSAATEPA